MVRVDRLCEREIRRHNRVAIHFSKELCHEEMGSIVGVLRGMEEALRYLAL